jgi:hypothetical protein
MRLPKFHRAIEGVVAGDRFRYWAGASGRRYLFARIVAEDLSDYHGAIGLELRDGLERDPVVAALFQVDEEGTVTSHPTGVSVGRAGPVYVHLLATRQGDRHAVLLDLAAALMARQVS